MTQMTGGQALVQSLKREGLDTLFALPGAQGGNGVFAEGCTPLLAAFPVPADVCARPQREVVPAEPAYLGDAQAGLDREQQQRPVAPPRPGER